MRVGPMASAAATVDQRTVQRRANRPADATHGEPPAARAAVTDLRVGLPTEVADRLALIMAGDPGLATAVSAQLPEARLRSASDLAAYATTVATGRAVDVSG